MSDDEPVVLVCKTVGCECEIEYRPRPVVVWEYRPSGARSSRTVYLTCPAGHTHAYEP